MRVKPSHVILLSQSSLCIPGSKHCNYTVQTTRELEVEKTVERKRKIAIQVEIHTTEPEKVEKQRSETE